MSAPFNVGLMLLLTDGSVLAQNAGTSLWWRLRPDRAGRYATGEWRETAASTSAPLYFASAVLTDGSVFIAGGEYDNNASQQSNLCIAESYDPIAESWQSLSTPPNWTAIGDAPCCVLPDGRVLLGNINGGPCAIWNPAAAKWSATGPKLNNSSSEETWTLLPDGSVLTADCVGQPASERFVNNNWVANGTTVASLVEVTSSEIGPAILLPDGTVFALGATGATARFALNTDRTQPGIWTVGPNVPADASGQTLAAKDAPACLLPNGRVLCALGQVNGTADSYAGPTSFFEFDPADGGAWVALLTPPNETGLSPYSFCFLLLPNGQVLASNGTPTVQIFQPDGAPDTAWAPTIQTCPTTIQAGATVRLQGTQLNGLSQACAYGADAAMATNYPLVRLRVPFPSDATIYCRTSGHSTMGVATGRALVHTDFTVPADAKPGIYHLCVVANGIQSAELPVNVTSTFRPRRSSAANQTAAPAPQSQTFAEEELFLRDLAEVHLLLDFVSGRANKSLAGLKNLPGYGVDGKPADSLTALRVVEDICLITYPPEGSLEANAHQAAFMLMVKDRLNELAQPARGLTVAFTSMFAGVALQFPKPSALRKANGAQAFFSAQKAYPNLEEEARKFRAFCYRLPLIAGVLVSFIIYANWDISLTGAVLQRIEAADVNYARLFSSDRDFPPTEANCKAVTTPNDPHKDACQLADSARAEEMESQDNLRDLIANRGYLRPIALSVRLLGPKFDTTNHGPPAITPSPTRASPQAWAIARSPLQMFTSAAINALNSIVIPAAFGWLGTLAGVLRSTTVRLFASTLAPRDRQVTRISLILGMVAGLAVGLYFNGNDPNGAIAKNLGSTITVSAAALSFLAGFGADAFFGFLDRLLVRLMPAGETGGGTVPETADASTKGQSGK